MIGGVITSMWTIMTCQIPFVPTIIGFILALPFYLFILIIIDLIFEYTDIIVKIFTALTHWLG
jgi:hypothetical protein